jgi:hypothetical protein
MNLAQWCTPVVLATQDTEMDHLNSQVQVTLSKWRDPTLKKKKW